MSDWVDPDEGRDFRTVVPPALYEEYYSSLGRLMNAFASVEVNLSLTVASYVSKHVHPERYYRPQYETPPGSLGSPADMLKSQSEASLWLLRKATLQAVLGSTRFAPLRDTLKRLLRVTDASEKIVSKVNNILAQFGEIQFMRDRLAHNGATPDLRNKDGWFSTSNWHTATEEQQSETIYFKPSMLVSMSRDLVIGLERLSEALDIDEMEESLKADPQWIKLMESPEMREYEADKNGPWHFKPSELKREGPKHQKQEGPKDRPPRQSRKQGARTGATDG